MDGCGQFGCLGENAILVGQLSTSSRKVTTPSRQRGSSKLFSLCPSLPLWPSLNASLADVTVGDIVVVVLLHAAVMSDLYG